MEQATLNPVMLALIGAPTLAGFLFRIRRWSPHAFRVNAIASCAVMFAVAIGYAFATFDRPNSFFVSYSHGISVVLIGVAMGGAMFWLLQGTDLESPLTIPVALALYGFAAWTFCLYVPTAYAMPLAALALFGVLGLANAALGTLAIGFSISATLHSLLLKGSLDYIFLWKDLFELFKISNGGIKLMIIGTTSLAGSGDILAWLAGRVADGNA